MAYIICSDCGNRRHQLLKCPVCRRKKRVNRKDESVTHQYSESGAHYLTEKDRLRIATLPSKDRKWIDYRARQIKKARLIPVQEATQIAEGEYIAEVHSTKRNKNRQTERNLNTKKSIGWKKHIYGVERVFRGGLPGLGKKK